MCPCYVTCHSKLSKSFFKTMGQPTLVGFRIGGGEVAYVMVNDIDIRLTQQIKRLLSIVLPHAT